MKRYNVTVASTQFPYFTTIEVGADSEERARQLALGLAESQPPDPVVIDCEELP